jgi:methionyl-tRNA formyltransferase
MKMDEGLDTGSMALAERVAIGADDTAGDLHVVLAGLGADAMARALAAAERGSLTLTPQPSEGVTYAEKISKSESRIAWARVGREVHNHIRGLSTWPGAWFEYDGVRIKVLRSSLAQGSGAPGTVLDDKLTIACGAGAVRLRQVQRAGRAPMSADEFLRGARIARGTQLH